MEQKPQWDKLVPIPYIFDTKGYIAHLKTILGSGNPRFAKHDANINAVIAMYENGYEGGKKIFLIEGKQVGSLEEALLTRDQSGLRLVQCPSLCFECFLTAGIERNRPPGYSEGQVPI